jgi:hypothetical protein
MSVQFHAYHEVAAVLPQKVKDIVESKTAKARVNLQSFNVNGGKETKNWFPLIIALGVIIALGGVFLTLAAHQVLPQGVNAISNLGVGGQALGYCVIGLGVLIAIIGAVKSHHVHKQNSKIAVYKDGVEGVHNNAEEAEMDSYFPNRLNKDEFFIVDIASRSEITIYYCEWDEKNKMAYPRYEVASYAASSLQTAFEEWCGKHQTFMAGASSIDLQTLRQRTEAFEDKKK